MLAKKQNLKRVFSSFLALIMLLGLLPTSAFAAGSGKPAEVVDQGEVVTSKDGLVTVHKTAKHTDGNNFDITLEVTTKDQVQVTPAQPTHVVLVIDRSNSMAGQRIKSTRQAAKEFAQIVLGEDAAEDNQIAVVSYTRSWESRIGLSGDLGAVETAIDQINTWGNETYGGTNIQSGIYAAEQILAQDSSDADKVIVLFSDGYPTYCYELTGTAKGACTGGIMWPGDVDASTIQITGRDTKSIIGPGNDSEIQGDWWDWFNLFTGDNLSLTVTCTIDEAVHNFFHGKNHVEYQDVKYDYETGSISKRADTSWNTIWEADQAKSNAQLYTVLLSPASHSEAEQAKTLMAKLASEGKYYETSNTNELAEIFKGIAGSITTPTNAGMVTDPMGQFITLGDVSGLADQGVTKTQDGLTWNVAASTPKENSDGSKTYTVTYPVTLNTEAEGFVDGQAYAANGTTTFNYTVNGEARSVNFDVPTVRGYVPEYTYKVEYYQQQNATKGDYEHYTKIERDTYNGPKTDLWTPVSIEKVDAGYETKYASDNYHYAKGDPSSITISAMEDNNVIKLYYDRDEASVTVNHFYKTDKYDADGTFTAGTYPETPQTSSTKSEYVGESFTAEQVLNYGGKAYEFDRGDDTITVNKDDSKNVINLYYTRTEDDRADASVVVNHVYRTHTWTLENGKYVLKDSVQNEDKVEESTGLKATTQYTAKTNPVEGFKDFTYDTTSTNSITLEPGENVITLYFDKTVDDREEVSLTVNHHYTKTVVTIGEDGQPVTTVDPDDHVETVTVKAYKGETVTLSEQNSYKDDTYNSDSGNAEKLTQTNVQGGEVIDLYYTIYQAPETTSVTVNHIYRTITHETVEITDPETGEVTGTEVVDSVKTDDTNDVTIHNLYVDQSYTAEKEGREGYTFNEGESDDLTAIVKADGATVINLYYDKDEDKDDRDAADIDVKHIYTTHLTTIVGGEVKTIDVQDGFAYDLPYEGKAGDTFTATPNTTFNQNEYTMVGTPDLEVVLQPGTNSTIVIHYERSANNLVDTSYTVNYVYNTYTMVVEDGVAKYGEPSVETVNGTAQSGYVGQIVTLSDGAKDDFTAAPTNPATSQTLTDGENVYTFVYNKYVPLDKVNVTVNHHYTTTTIAVDGTSSSSTSDTLGTPVEKYAGEHYVAAAVANGFTYDRYTVTDGIANTQDEATKNVTVTATGDVVVDFYYSKTVDNSKPVNYSIQHVYVTINWDGTRTVSRSEPITGSSYATKQLSAATDNNGGNYKLVSAYFNNETVPGFDPADPQDTYAVTLVDGENAIVYTYERNVDNRQATQVKVIHNYYARDTYTVDGTLSDADYIAQETVKPEYRTEHVYDTFKEGIWVGNEYTATMYNIVYFKDDQGHASIERVYDLVNATPEGGKIASIAALDEGKLPAGNVVTFNLIRKYSSDPGDVNYTVVHEYYTDGSLSGFVEVPGTGKVGDVITAESIEKKTTYKDNSYEYVSADKESITLGADGAYNVITLRYEGSTSIGPSVTRYDLVVKYLEQGTEKELANTYRTTVRRGNDYDATSRTEKEIDGYVIVDVTGDAVKGTMNGDKEIIVWYEADDNEIVDPETPLNPDPGTDPDDGNNNPGDGGETDIGDPETPLNPDPGTGDGTGDGAGNVPGDGGETDIGDGETPMGDLPQTGMTAAPVNPTVTVGLVALAMSMASLGLFFTFGRKKGEEED